MKKITNYDSDKNMPLPMCGLNNYHDNQTLFMDEILMPTLPRLRVLSQHLISFLREDPRFDSLDVRTTIVVFEGCLVPVSIHLNADIKLA